MMRGKTSFSKKIQDPLDRYECEQACPLGGELCPKTFIHHSFTSRAIMNVPFCSAFIMNVQ